jgi:predicted thioesterase
MEIEIGATGSADLVVGRQDTAIALGSGDVPVLGTPRVVALLEEAAVAALAGDLADGITSVGTHIAVDHQAASLVGAKVSGLAEVVSVEGRTVSFRLTAREGNRTVASGSHTRVIVDRKRFLGSR